MRHYQREFLQFALARGVLQLGEFTLKSGRLSPYFFNAGLFNTGTSLSCLGAYYASAIMDHGMQFDVLFGPAYKGIPLVAATAMALADQHDREVPYCFNRKEVKNHGEGGNLIGAPLEGRVVIIDDVITAGTAIREAMDIIAANGAEAAGIVIALDRMERGRDRISAVQEIESDYGLKIINIASLELLIQFIEQSGDYGDYLQPIQDYRQRYGV